MRTLTLFLILLSVGCSKAKEPPLEVTTSTSLEALCLGPTSTTHTFVNWPLQSAQDYNCTGLYAKMDCHYYVGISGAREIVCSDIDVAVPHGVPAGYQQYADGTREFFDGTVRAARAFDGGTRYNGLRCFYFVETDSTANENIVCQAN